MKLASYEVSFMLHRIGVFVNREQKILGENKNPAGFYKPAGQKNAYGLTHSQTSER